MRNSLLLCLLRLGLLLGDSLDLLWSLPVSVVEDVVVAAAAAAAPASKWDDRSVVEVAGPGVSPILVVVVFVVVVKGGEPVA